MLLHDETVPHLVCAGCYLISVNFWNLSNSSRTASTY